MARKYKGGANFGFSLNFTSAVPSDLREYVDNIADLIDPSSWTAGTYNSSDDSKNVYVLIPSQRVSVHNEGTIYQFKSNSVDKNTISNIDNWQRLATIDDVLNNIVGAQVYKGSKTSLSEILNIANPNIGDLWNLNQPVSVKIVDASQVERIITNGSAARIATSDSYVDATMRSYAYYGKLYFYAEVGATKTIYALTTPSRNTWGDTHNTDINALLGHADDMFPHIDYDPTIQGMNYCCYAKFANMVDSSSTQSGGVYTTKKYEDGSSIKFYDASGTMKTGNVKFVGENAVIVVSSGTSSKTYEFSSGNLYSEVTSIKGKTKVLGEWDAQGTTLQDAVTKTELEGGFVKAGVAVKSDKLSTARSIDGVKFDGSADISRYITCNNTGDTIVKAVTINGFTLTSGACVRIKFNYDNTATTPQLNVSSTGAKVIKVGNDTFNKLKSGIVYQFVYNGTDWQVSGGAGTGLSDDDSRKLDTIASIASSNPYDTDIATLDGADRQYSKAIYDKMVADYNDESQRRKLKFINCDGVKCKFDILSYDLATNTIEFSIISKGKFYRGKFVLNGDVALLTWINKADDLSTMFNQVVSLGTIANIHEQRLSIVEANVSTALSRTTWIDLDA